MLWAAHCAHHVVNHVRSVEARLAFVEISSDYLEQLVIGLKVVCHVVAVDGCRADAALTIIILLCRQQLLYALSTERMPTVWQYGGCSALLVKVFGAAITLNLHCCGSLLLPVVLRVIKRHL